MARAPSEYTRLTRNASGLGSYSSLWGGREDLVLAQSTGFSEHYSRLRLRDIKGVFILPSDRRFWWGVGWGLLLVVAGIIMPFGWTQHGPPVGGSILGGFALIMLTWNFLLGPSCRMYVLTEVQLLQLPAPVRHRRARRLIDRLQPLIVAVQADLVPAPSEPAPAETSAAATAVPPPAPELPPRS